MFWNTASRCSFHYQACRFPISAIPVLTARGFFMGGVSVEHSAGNGRVTVDTSISQERPVTPDILQFAQVDFANQDFFFIVRSLGND
jgi:hypothetical protein